ncbi:MAG: 3-keto-disaccharide hydrolase [Balneolaceae bacterium]
MKKLSILLAVVALSFSNLYAQLPEPASGEEVEYTQLLTEDTFDQWEGNSEYWRFEDGVLIGETTEENPLEENNFIVWEKEVDDFELKVETRISANGNSGIQYRSEAQDGNLNILKGYQADLDGPNNWTGQVYEERGREFLAGRGQITWVLEDDTPVEIGSLGEEEDLLGEIRPGEWNEYHLIVRDDTIIQLFNGRVMSIVIDDGDSQRAEGILGLQLHTGPPMKAEYRNMRFRQL